MKKILVFVFSVAMIFSLHGSIAYAATPVKVMSVANPVANLVSGDIAYISLESQVATQISSLKLTVLHSFSDVPASNIVGDLKLYHNSTLLAVASPNPVSGSTIFTFSPQALEPNTPQVFRIEGLMKTSESSPGFRYTIDSLDESNFFTTDSLLNGGFEICFGDNCQLGISAQQANKSVYAYNENIVMSLKIFSRDRYSETSLQPISFWTYDGCPTFYSILGRYTLTCPGANEKKATANPTGRLITATHSLTSDPIGAGEYILSMNAFLGESNWSTFSADYFSGPKSVVITILPKPTPKYSITLSKTGTGSGTVSDGTGLINCGTTCSAQINQGLGLNLLAKPSSGSIFVGWQGIECVGGQTNPNCVQKGTVSGAMAVTAQFALINNSVTLTKSGDGTGNMVSVGAFTTTGSLVCGVLCNTITGNTTKTIIQFVAVPSNDSEFVSWTNCPAQVTGSSVCTVTFSNSLSSLTLIGTFKKKPAPVYSIAVTKSGTGAGTVTGGGVNCGATCTTSYTSGTGSVTLVATPDANSTFTGWSGACSGAGSCILTPTANVAITASFAQKVIPPSTYTISLQKNGTGSGVVSGGGITCGTTCSITYTAGTPAMVFSATPSAGSTFTGWSGACTGTGSCSVAPSANTVVIATFTSNPITPSTYTLNVNKTGTGSGVVNGGAISCGTTCSATLTAGNPAITLTATADATSNFVGWSGACTGTLPCSIPTSAHANVTAQFDAKVVVPPTTGAKYYDFGGAYGSYTPTTGAAVQYKNPTTNALSCPSGYNPYQISGGTTDSAIFICMRDHVDGVEPIFDYAGGYGPSYLNPISKTISCPDPYSPIQVTGGTKDQAVFLCAKDHVVGNRGAYYLGGAYGYYMEGGVKKTYPNPATGLASCPSGFLPQKLKFKASADQEMYVCSTDALPEPPPVYDFGGGYGFYTVSGVKTPYVNRVTGATSCPVNYTDVQISGSGSRDDESHICIKQRVRGAEPAYDFAAGYGGKYNNPVTGSISCPYGYFSTQVSGGVDASAFICYRPHTPGQPSQYDFGGAYGFFTEAGKKKTYPNPATGLASCPADYTAQQIRGATTDKQIFICYRAASVAYLTKAPLKFQAQEVPKTFTATVFDAILNLFK